MNSSNWENYSVSKGGNACRYSGKIKKSYGYRKDLEPFLGKTLTIEVPNYKIKYVGYEFTAFILLNSVLMGDCTSSTMIPNTNPIDHMRMHIPNSMLDHFSRRKPLRIDGLVYEYTKPDSYGKPVLNLAMEPSFVSQITWQFASGQSFGAVPDFVLVVLGSVCSTKKRMTSAKTEVIKKR